MFAFLLKLLLIARSRLKSRASLEAENLVLRQQVIVLSRNSPSRVWLRNIDRLIFVWLYRCFPAILNAITVVKPETVIRWHRRGFRAYWRWKSRRRGGRPRIDREIRDLIRRMSKENLLWGAPRIHGELLMLGIEVAQSTVARYMTRSRGHPPRVGRHSCAIMPPGSRPSICSWFAPSPSNCSMAWSFFVTPAGDW